MYERFQQPPLYGSTGFNAQPMYTNQYEIPYANNTYMNQQSQPIYETAPNQPPPYSIYEQPQPVYQTVPQQPPPYSSFVQQQQPQNKNNPAPPGAPLSKGYKWPRHSIPVVCPNCGTSVTTRPETKITIVTIIGAVLLFCFTCILVCLPFCVPACKNTTHYCPHCNSVLGVRHALR
jgi:hypothetical protein